MHHRVSPRPLIRHPPLPVHPQKEVSPVSSEASSLWLQVSAPDSIPLVDKTRTWHTPFCVDTDRKSRRCNSHVQDRKTSMPHHLLRHRLSPLPGQSVPRWSAHCVRSTRRLCRISRASSARPSRSVWLTLVTDAPATAVTRVRSWGLSHWRAERQW